MKKIHSKRKRVAILNSNLPCVVAGIDLKF